MADGAQWQILSRIMLLNNVRQHNCFIMQGSYIGYISTLYNRLLYKVVI